MNEQIVKCTDIHFNRHSREGFCACLKSCLSTNQEMSLYMSVPIHTFTHVQQKLQKLPQIRRLKSAWACRNRLESDPLKSAWWLLTALRTTQECETKRFAHFSSALCLSVRPVTTAQRARNSATVTAPTTALRSASIAALSVKIFAAVGAGFHALMSSSMTAQKKTWKPDRPSL